METLDSTETLADDSSQPPGSQALEAPDALIRSRREAESRVSGPGLSPKKPRRRLGGGAPVSRAVPAADSPAPKQAAEAETLETAVPDHDGTVLGLRPGGSPGKGEAAEDLAGAEEEPRGGEESSFAVGDFVWAKIKSHPWWPGLVYDPSQASDHAKKAHRKEQCVLVAYFGDSSFAWCEPAQLKSFEAEFHQMVGQSSSKSFVGAVGDALNMIGRSLESELTCHCVPAEERSELEKMVAVDVGGQAGNLSTPNYAPGELLELLRDAARDASAASLLEATMLRSWVSVFGKMCLASNSFVFRKRRETADLVDKIDLDAPPAELFEEDQGQEAGWITGSGIMKKPEISEEKLYRSRKKRSMAKLIAEMDLDSVELSDGEEEEEPVAPDKSSPSKHKNKKDENKKGSDVENESVKAEEETSLGRRERKKSKYLSPPYTYLSGATKIPGSPKSTELKIPTKATEATRALLSGSPRILKCNSIVFEGEEEDNRSPLFKIDSISASDILSEFLSTAIYPLHLKWNRSAKTVKGFFAIFRSSVYSNGSDFDAYQKHLGDCRGVEGKSANKELANGSEEVRPKEKRRRKGRASEETPSTPSNLDQDTTAHSEQGRSQTKGKMRKEGADEVTLLKLGQDTADRSEQGKPGTKRKMWKEGADARTPLDLGQDSNDPPEQGKSELKRKTRKEGAVGVTPLNFDQGTIGPIKQGKEGPKRKTRKGGADAASRVDLGQDTTDPSEQGKSGQKRKVRKEGADGVTPLDLGQDRKDPFEQGKSGQKRKMRKEGADGATPLGLGQDTKVPSEQGKDGSKRKVRKDGATEETPLKSVHDVTDRCEQGKSMPKGKMGKHAANIKAPVDLNLQIEDGLEEAESPHNKKGMDGASGEPINGAEAGKQGQKMIKGKQVCNEKTPMELGLVLVNPSEEVKLGQKKKKSKNGPNGEAPVDLGCEIINGMKAGRSRQKRKKKDATTYESPAALLLTFAPGNALPSKDDLNSTFSKYGDLIETETGLSKDSGCARVVFAKSIDAEKAFNSRDKSGAFGPSCPSYRVRYLPGNSSSPLPPIPIPKPPLPYIRKSLERMISTLAGSSAPDKGAGSSDGLKPEARDNLVGEMKGLLKKVDKMLTGPTAGISS